MSTPTLTPECLATVATLKQRGYDNMAIHETNCGKWAFVSMLHKPTQFTTRAVFVDRHGNINGKTAKAFLNPERKTRK